MNINIGLFYTENEVLTNMNYLKQIIAAFVLVNVLFTGFSSFADCGDAATNAMDNQCAGVCGGTDGSPKGCYYPPDSSTSLTNEMCSNKTGGTYPNAKDTICCCQ